MRKKHVFGALGVALAALASPGQGRAADPANRAPAPAPRSVARTIGGIEVQIDPQTGRLVEPTPEKARELASYLIRTLDRSPEGLEIVRHADGTLSIQLGERLQSVMLVTRGEDGRVTPYCVTDASAGEALLEAATHGVDPVAVRAPATLEPASGTPIRRAVEK